MDKKTMTTEEVAEILKVNPRTISRLIKRDFLPAFKVGNKWRFFQNEVEKWIKANRSGVLAIKEKKPEGVITEAEPSVSIVNTVQVPVIGLITAGQPILAEQNIEEYISVSKDIAKGTSKYFILKVRGDSMNLKGINDGDYILVKQQNTADENDIVVALIDVEATVKEYHRQGNMIILKPYSSNPTNKEIYLTENENVAIQGKYVMTLPKV